MYVIAATTLASLWILVPIVTVVHAVTEARHAYCAERHIEQYDVVGVAGETLQTGLAAIYCVDAVALIAQDAAKRTPHTGFVIDNQNGRH